MTFLMDSACFWAIIPTTSFSNWRFLWFEAQTFLTYLHTYSVTYLFTDSMEQSLSWEANVFSANQEIPRILLNPKVHYRIHKFPPPVPTLSRLDSFYAPTSHYLKTHLNIILQSTSGSSKWSLFLRFPHQNSVHTFTLPHKCHLPRTSHSSLFDHPNNIRWGVLYMISLVTVFVLKDSVW